MKLKIVAIIFLLGLFFYWLPQPESGFDSGQLKTGAESNFNQHFMVRNVRLYDGQTTQEKIDLLVENNRFKLIGHNIQNPANYPELDGTNKTLIPGLIDAHTHTWGSALSQALNFGVTTELDMFTMPASSKPHQAVRDDLTNVAQADLFSATILATAPKGHGTEYGFEIPVLTSEAEVDQFVADRIADGADYIKAVYQAAESKRMYYPSISKAVLARLIEVAHRNQKMLVVHVDNLISAEHAIQLGADGIIHSFMDQTVDPAFIDLMLAKKAFIIPTLTVQASAAKLGIGQLEMEAEQSKPYLSIEQRQFLAAAFPDFGIPPSAYAKAQQSVALLAAAGVPILAGSDAPNPGTAHGVSLHSELRLLVEAGLTPQQALHSATGAVARQFPIGQRGLIAEGAPASMLLLDGNPLQDINATQSILKIWKNGVEFARQLSETELALEVPIASSLIADFNHSSEQTAIGAGIMPTTDQFAGGDSIVNLSLVDKLAVDGDTALRVSGEVKAGFAFPWSGFSYLPGKSITEGANLTQIEQLVFDAKSDGQIEFLTVMIFQQGSFQPSSVKVALDDQWQSHRISLAEFKNVDLTRISNISFVASGIQGAFEFAIDNLKFE